MVDFDTLVFDQLQVKKISGNEFIDHAYCLKI